MRLPIITEEGLNLIGLDSCGADPMIVNLDNGDTSEAYHFVLHTRRGKLIGEYLVLQTGVVMYCGKNYQNRTIQQRKLKPLFKDKLIEWRDIDINCPFPEIAPTKIW